MKTAAWLFSYCLISSVPVACTIKSVNDDSETTSKGGTAGNGGEGGSARNEAGTNSQAGGGTAPCGAVTVDGKCDKTEAVFCDGEKVKRIDCAVVGAECVLVNRQAQCVVPNRTASCGNLTALGTCDGATIKYCDSSSVVVATAAQIDCAAYGQTCDADAASDGGAQCVPAGACPANLSENGLCYGNVLHFCDSGNEYVFDCGTDECKAESGFADCFMPSSVTGCGTETESGRCDGNVLIKCQSELISREDCAAIGLTCVTGSPSACLSATCPSTCAKGYACTNGRCTPSNSPSRQWTVLVYMVGDNNLADAAWSDINEMEENGSTDQVQVAVQWELSSQYTSVAPKSYRGTVYRTPIVKDTDPNTVAGLASSASLGEMNLSDPARLAEFVRWGVESYPAQHTAVILWDHGFGWRGGFVDSNSASSMTLKDLVTGLKDSGVHPDVVAFDACLMGMHEVGMALRGVTDTLVASEEVSPGGGFPYNTILNRWTSNPSYTAHQFGTAIAEEYSSYFDTGLRARSVTMSVVDLTKIDENNAKLAEFSRSVLADLASNRRGIAGAVGSKSLMRYPEAESADIRSMLNAFAPLDGSVGPASTSYIEWFSTSGLIVTNKAIRTVADSSGLAIHLPRSAFSAYNANSLQDYRERTSFLPLQPWHQVVASLSGAQETASNPSTVGATSFNVKLSWGDSPTSNTSSVDLDLYVYEPGGDFGTPANGAVTANGLLSADSGESGLSQESYELRPVHASGTYLILVNLFQGTKDQVAYPQLTIERDDAKTITYLRGKYKQRDLEVVPMSTKEPLEAPVNTSNIDDVLGLKYSSIWYVAAINVR